LDPLKERIALGGEANACKRVLDGIPLHQEMIMRTPLKKMPIHTLKVWVHKLVMVVFMLKDSRNK